MSLHLIRAIYSQPIKRLSLNKFVCKINRFPTPTFRNFICFDLNLSCQDSVSYFLSRSTRVRPFTHDAFVDNDSESKVVNSYPMVLSAENLRGHIPWSARSILRIFRSPHSCNSHIS